MANKNDSGIPEGFNPNCMCATCVVVRGSAANTLANWQHYVQVGDTAKVEAITQQANMLAVDLKNADAPELYRTAVAASNNYKRHVPYTLLTMSQPLAESPAEQVATHFSNGFESGYYHALCLVAALFPIAGLSDVAGQQEFHDIGRAAMFERAVAVTNN